MQQSYTRQFCILVFTRSIGIHITYIMYTKSLFILLACSAYTLQYIPTAFLVLLSTTNYTVSISYFCNIFLSIKAHLILLVGHFDLMVGYMSVTFGYYTCYDNPQIITICHAISVSTVIEYSPSILWPAYNSNRTYRCKQNSSG